MYLRLEWSLDLTRGGGTSDKSGNGSGQSRGPTDVNIIYLLSLARRERERESIYIHSVNRNVTACKWILFAIFIDTDGLFSVSHSICS